MGNAKIAETTKDASDMAQHIYNNMGGQANVMPQVQNGGNGQANQW